MRVSFWNRLICALAGLILLALGVAVFIVGSGFLPLEAVVKAPQALWQRLVVMAGAVLVAMIGVFCIGMLFRRSGNDRGFVIQSTENGDMSISITAMENMVQKCTDSHKELTAKHIRMRHAHEGVAVDLKVLLQNGCNIPQTIGSLQREIKQYINDCSGVPVSEVRVMVETDMRRSHSRKILDMSAAPKNEEIPIPAPAETAAEPAKHAEPAEHEEEEPVPKAEDRSDSIAEPDAEEAFPANDESMRAEEEV